MKKSKYLYILVIFIFNLFSNQEELNLSCKQFIKSFIQTFDPESSFVREYNSYILNKTEQTFLDLEKRLSDEKFNLAGRIAILGFQEDGVAPYTTDWQRNCIADEAIIEKNDAVIEPAKNVFGFMTGFLLKDAQYMQSNWDKNNIQVFNIASKEIQIFKDEFVAFQKHAFGKDYDELISFRDKIEEALFHKDLKLVLSYLVDFWCFLEKNFSKTGSGQIACTQDVLFSIAYAKTLINSKVPVTKFFVGPDITYPIEVLDFQYEKATAHAQLFLNSLQEHLKPINNEKTAYIFSSYVDGVGKSTLLNNILNYKKYNNNYNLYERCDNSSSQEVTFFDFNDNVILCDLPGQVSHTVFKSDGYVFVDTNTIKNFDQDKISKVLNYANKNNESIKINFNNILENIFLQNNLRNNLYDKSNINDFVYLYAQNCLNLQINSPEFVAFEFENQTYLINEDQNLKILVPLSQAHSTGLKSIHAEQMLFTNGLSLPMSYKSFLDKLVLGLKNNGVKNIIFIDFMSMYPRTSRESVRVNFIIQYLERIFKEKYSFKDSFYMPRVFKGQELFYLLQHKMQAVTQTLYLETLLRASINYIIESNTNTEVVNLSGKDLEDKLLEIINYLENIHQKEIFTQAQKRLELELEAYVQNYTLDYIYESLILFNPNLAKNYINKINEFFTNNVHDNENYFKTIWSDFKTDNIEIASIDKNCKDLNKFKSFSKTLRAQLYALLSNLLYANTNNNNFYLQNYSVFVPPFNLKFNNNNLELYQKAIPTIELQELGQIEELENFFNRANLFHIDLSNCNWGIFDEKFLHCLNWNTKKSNGIYSYGFLTKNINSLNMFVLTKWQEMHDLNITNGFTTTTDVYQYLQSEVGKLSLSNDIKKIENLTTIYLNDPKINAIRFWARAIATLDMIIKDPDSKILLRFNNKSDFISGIKLLEKIVLPFFFNISLEQDLFENYNEIEPIIKLSENN